MAAAKRRIGLNRLLELSFGSFVLPGVSERNGLIHVHDGRKWVQRKCDMKLGQALLEAVLGRKQKGIKIMGVGVVGA